MKKITDTERLNWLLKRYRNGEVALFKFRRRDYKKRRYTAWIAYSIHTNKRGEGSSPREAIDNAIKSEKL